MFKIHFLLISLISFTFIHCATKPNLKLNEKDNLYPIRQGEKWGYIDDSGKVVVEPQYDLTYFKFKGKYWIISSKQAYAVDSKGTVLDSIPKDIYREASYRTALPKCYGISYIYDIERERTTYFNASGKQLFSFEGYGRGFDTMGYALVHGTGRRGKIMKNTCFIDTLGRLIFQLPGEPFDNYVQPYITDFTGWTNSSNRMGVIDKRGNIILPDTFQMVGIIPPDHALLSRVPVSKNDDPLFALYNLKTKQFITAYDIQDRYETMLFGFAPNLMLIRRNNKIQYINKAGKVVWSEE